MGKVKLTFITGIKDIDSHKHLFSQKEWDVLMIQFKSLSHEQFMEFAISEIDSKMSEKVAISEIDSKMSEKVEGIEVIDILDFFEAPKKKKKK